MEPVPNSPKPRRSHPTIRDVAERADVGLGTVSRVLNGGANVSESKRTRVERAIVELGFRPSPAARALSRGRASAIGITAPHLTRPSVVERLRGVIATLGTSTYDLGLATVETPEQRERRLADVCTRNRPDGLIVISLTPTVEEAEQLRDAEIPAVFVDAKAEGFPTVDIDDVAGGRLATEHLLALGHSRIAFLGDIPEEGFHFTSSNHRYRGYTTALEVANIEPRAEYVVTGEHSRDVASRIATALLDRPGRPTAVFASSDTQALGVLKAAGSLGLRVPEDLSVVGFDDLEIAALVGLTTVRQPLFDSGRRGAELLLEQMDGHADAGDLVSVLLPLDLVQRHTTGPPPTRAHRQRPGKR